MNKENQPNTREYNSKNTHGPTMGGGGGGGGPQSTQTRKF